MRAGRPLSSSGEERKVTSPLKVLDASRGLVGKLLKSYSVDLQGKELKLADETSAEDVPLQRDASTDSAHGPASITTHDPAQTEAVGAQLAALLRPGDVVLVTGELGAGKTTWVRGACRALGVSVPVTSPTFTIGQRYAGSVPVSHLDLFRVDGLDSEEPELLDDYIAPDTIAFVEWPPGEFSERRGLFQVAWRITIEHRGGDRRLIELEPAGLPAEARSERVRSPKPANTGF
jgi:tRNA threonylcarbamoyladenosine biosynthesis protein TsaE